MLYAYKFNYILIYTQSLKSSYMLIPKLFTHIYFEVCFTRLRIGTVFRTSIPQRNM